MKYFIYCRKSSEEETKQIQSLETQERMLTEYADKYNLEIVEILKESKSAKTDGNRPLFSSMLERIKNKEASGVLVLHTDRLSRNGIESGQLIKLFEMGFIKEIRTPSRTYNSVTDMLYIDFDFVFAAHYSRNLSIRVKEGIETKLQKGEYPSYSPVGYVNKVGKIYPDPLREKHIQKAYKLYNSGEYTLKQISNILFADGFRTRIGNNKVHKSVIHRIFTDPVYYGAIRRKGTLYKGIHEPLVSKSLFDKVNDRLVGKNHSRKQKHTFLYDKFLSCKVCGCKLTASIKKGLYIYYYCTNSRSKCLEHKKYIPEGDMETLVKELIANFNLKKDMADLSLDLYIDDLKEEYKDKVFSKDILAKQILSIDEKLDRLLDLRIGNAIDEEKYKEKQTKLKNEKTELEISRGQLKANSLETTLELLYEIKNRACSLKELFDCDDFQVKSDVLNSLLWKLEIESQKIASVQYKLPYEYLKDVSKSDDILGWRRGRDSNSRRTFILRCFQDIRSRPLSDLSSK